MTAPLAPLPGIFPALLTPLRPDGCVDHAAFVAHARALIAAGAGGVTPFGTTGEGLSFSVEERIAAVDALVAGGVPGSQILVHTSAAALTDVLALTRHALAIGAWGCLMLPPFYFKGVSDTGIADSYTWIVEQAADPRLRVMLYHIPQVAGVGLSQGVIRTLLDRHPGVFVGIKDSQCETAHSLVLAAAFMRELTVHVGNEPDLPALGRLGSTGAVSGLANFWPERVRRMVCTPDAASTPADLDQIKRLLAVLGGYALIPALKGIMALRDGNTAWLRVRAPLVALDEAGLARLRTALDQAGLDIAQDRVAG